MRWRSAFSLLLAVAALGAFMAVFERRQPAPARRLSLDDAVLDWGVAPVTALTVVRGTSTVECVEQHGRWYMTGTTSTRASAAAVRRVLEAVKSTRIRERIAPAQMAARGLTPDSYGLSDPQLKVSVAAGRSRYTLTLGNEAPLGGLVFAQTTGPDVLAVTADVVGAVPRAVEDWAARAVMPESIVGATRLEIKQPGGFVQLALKDGSWRLQQPRSAKAADVVVEKLLEGLAQLRVESAGPAVTGVDLVAYGLGPDDNPLQATVWAGGDDEGVTLSLGKPVQEAAGLVYARVSDMATLCRLPQSAVGLLSVTADDLRDRRICQARPADIVAIRLQDADHHVELEHDATGWRVKDPVRGRADTLAVSLFLREFCALASVGFPELGVTNLPTADVGDVKVVLSDRPLQPAGTNAPAAGVRGAGPWTFRVQDSTGAVATIVAEETRAVYSVRRADLARLARSAGGVTRAFSDPLAYMDRAVLDVPAESIRRITLAYGGREEAVVRDATGNWQAESPPESKIVGEAVAGTLQAVAPLRCLRLETLSATNLAAYGLADDAVTRLTFGLSGQAGIQKTLILSTNAAPGGVYATVQGQDAVFIVDRDVATRLTRSMVTWQ